ncbi:MAG: hypothetical protein ABR990_13595 [Terracidiphilus sp.]
MTTIASTAAIAAAGTQAKRQFQNHALGCAVGRDAGTRAEASASEGLLDKGVEAVGVGMKIELGS